MSTATIRLYGAAIVLAPLVGVGVAQLFTGRTLGFGIQPSFVPLVLLLALVIPAAVSTRSQRWNGDAVALVMALSWVCLSASFVWRLDDIGLVGEVAWLKSLKQLVTLVFFVAIAWVPVWLVHRSPQPRVVLAGMERAASVSLLLAAGYALFELLLNRFDPWRAQQISAWFATNSSIASGSEELYLGHAFTGLGRARGFFPEPLHLGSYLIATVPLAGAMAVGTRGWSRAWRAGAAGLGLVGLLATYSRGAYLGIAFVVGGLVVAGLRGRLPGASRRAVLLVAGLGLVVLLGVFSLVAGLPPWRVPGLLIDRVLQSLAGHDMSNLTRLYAWRAAGSMFLEHPWTGVGWGAYGFHYFDVAGSTGSGAHFGWPMANSMPLLVLAELGLVGGVLTARAVWPALRGAFAWSSASGEGAAWDALCTVLALSAGGVMIHMLTFSQWNLPHIWMLLGGSAAAHAIGREVV